MLSYTSVQKFDDNENVIEEKLFDPEGEIYQKNTMKYDHHNNLIEAVQTLRSPSIVTIKYDSNNDIVEYVYQSDNYISKPRHTYKYDKHNNWVKQTETDEDESYMIKRKLSY